MFSRVYKKVDYIIIGVFWKDVEKEAEIFTVRAGYQPTFCRKHQSGLMMVINLHIADAQGSGSVRGAEVYALAG